MLENKYKPKTLDDLVFESDAAKRIVEKYAHGRLTRSLILHGPPGSGKSSAARVIVNERLPSLRNSALTQPINGVQLTSEICTRIANDWSLQSDERGYTIIDEVDLADRKTQNALRDLIDRYQHGTLICTTNHVHKIEPALLDRMTKVEMLRPLAEDWVSRVAEICRSEGVQVDDQIARALLRDVEGSARDILDGVEMNLDDLRNLMK